MIEWDVQEKINVRIIINKKINAVMNVQSSAQKVMSKQRKKVIYVDKKKLTEILKDKDSFKKLKAIAIIQDEIHTLYRKIDDLKYESIKLEIVLQNKHKINPIDTMHLAIATEEILRKREKKE